MEDYQPLSKIGHGSYGEVWLSRHRTDKKKYVLKQINIQKASRRERDAANLEVKLLATLKHPNIVSYRDSFVTDDGFLYIAMGFCEGGDLYSRIKEQRGVPFEECQVAEWFIQICMALQYLHERNILHRDLKTQNIFLTKSKMVKVGDLGIAKVLGSSTDMATTLIGTPYYMSPELFSNKPYNYKSDVWALGCCIYEMATLKHAFNAHDINSLMSKILRGKLPVMPKYYSSDLVDVIRWLLHHDPAKRPTVSKVLRCPYVKRNISIFLDGTEIKNKPGIRPMYKEDKDTVSVQNNKICNIDDGNSSSAKVKSVRSGDCLRLDGQGIQLSVPIEEDIVSIQPEDVQYNIVPDDQPEDEIRSTLSCDVSKGPSQPDDRLIVNGFEMKLEERPSGVKTNESSSSSSSSPRVKVVIKKSNSSSAEDGAIDLLRKNTVSILPRLPAAVCCNGEMKNAFSSGKEFRSPSMDRNPPRPSSSSSNHARDRRRRRLVRDILENIAVEKPRPLPQLPVLPVIAPSSDRGQPERPPSVQSVDLVLHPEGQMNLCARQRRRERLRVNQPIPAILLGIRQN